MKIGTILKNNWAGKGNPVAYFIYLGTSGDYIKGLYCVDGKLKKARYYKKNMKTGMIEEAGYSEGINILKQDLIKMQKVNRRR